MSIIAEYYQQAELTFAAYADLYSGIPEDIYPEALKKANMFETQINDFISKYSVVTQYSDASVKGCY